MKKSSLPSQKIVESIEGSERVSYQAVNKVAVKGLNADIRKISQIMSLMPRIERQDNKIEMVTQFTTELMKIYSLA